MELLNLTRELLSAIEDHYIRAVQADPDNALILRQYDAYRSCFQKYESIRIPTRL